MATEKVSLTLNDATLKEARRRVGGRGLSGYVDSALRLKLQHDRLRDLLDELDARHGPVSDRVSDEVLREWPGKRDDGARRRSSRG